MSSVSAVVSDILKTKGAILSDEWLSQCITHLKYIGSFPSNPHTVAEKVYDLYLNADIYDVVEKCDVGLLPHNIKSMHKQYLDDTPIILQIDELVNVGNTVTSGEQKGDSLSGRLFKLYLTDGKQSVIGLEVKTINGLSSKLCIGSKLLVKRPYIRRGALILNCECAKFLGGEVEGINTSFVPAAATETVTATERGTVPAAVPTDPVITTERGAASATVTAAATMTNQRQQVLPQQPNQPPLARQHPTAYKDPIIPTLAPVSVPVETSANLTYQRQNVTVHSRYPANRNLETVEILDDDMLPVPAVVTYTEIVEAPKACDEKVDSMQVIVGGDIYSDEVYDENDNIYGDTYMSYDDNTYVPSSDNIENISENVHYDGNYNADDKVLAKSDCNPVVIKSVVADTSNQKGIPALSLSPILPSSHNSTIDTATADSSGCMNNAMPYAVFLSQSDNFYSSRDNLLPTPPTAFYDSNTIVIDNSPADTTTVNSNGYQDDKKSPGKQHACGIYDIDDSANHTQMDTAIAHQDYQQTACKSAEDVNMTVDDYAQIVDTSIVDDVVEADVIPLQSTQLVSIRHLLQLNNSDATNSQAQLSQYYVGGNASKIKKFKVKDGKYQCHLDFTDSQEAGVLGGVTAPSYKVQIGNELCEQFLGISAINYELEVSRTDKSKWKVVRNMYCGKFQDFGGFFYAKKLFNPSMSVMNTSPYVPATSNSDLSDDANPIIELIGVFHPT